MMHMKYEMKWRVGPHESEYDEPEKWVPAEVPGAVQLDWAKAEGWGSYTYAESYKQYEWMEDRFWTYSAKTELGKPSVGSRLFFVCKGIDYRFTVRLDGEVIHEQEGMFTPFELDLTERVHDNSELRISVFPAPKREGAPIGRAQADQSCKPAVSYGWDWHPRLIPLGIWDETYLEVRPQMYLADCETSYSMNESRSSAELTTAITWSASIAGKVRWRLMDRHGSELIMREAMIPKKMCRQLKASSFMIACISPSCGGRAVKEIPSCTRRSPSFSMKTIRFWTGWNRKSDSERSSSSCTPRLGNNHRLFPKRKVRRPSHWKSMGALSFAKARIGSIPKSFPVSSKLKPIGRYCKWQRTRI